MLEYKVVYSEHIEELQKLVNIAIADGWEPQGGFCWFEVYKAQAMVRETPHKDFQEMNPYNHNAT